MHHPLTVAAFKLLNNGLSPMRIITGFLVICLHVSLYAQECPPNIDFETGTFQGWTCYTGNTVSANGQNSINLNPFQAIPERHTMYAGNSGEVDQYGGFPVNCPNGSGYSIRLGNNTGGGEAEGISYEFTIPAGRNEYSLIYHYAVVFEDPRHEIHQQPRMQVEVSNVSDGTVISCSSFSFVPYGSALPGFVQSSVTGEDGTPVWWKDWSAVSINLDGLAGKTIRLFFKTADCTFRRHFGYAYIDVNSECSSEFVGASYCPDDTAATVVAPYGYQNYRWFTSDFSQVIGTQQSIRFNPPPVAGTIIAVEVTPYAGYGCIDTLYARMVDTLTIQANAGPDVLYCGNDPVKLGANPKPGLVYSWVPGTGLSDSTIANPMASPGNTTKYHLLIRNSGGGCRTQDSVVVTSSGVDKNMQLIGKAAFCIGTNDSAVLRVNPTSRIQWYKDGALLTDATQIQYKVTQSGNYYAQLHSAEGCVVNTNPQRIFIDRPRPGVRYPTEYAVVNEPYRLQARDFADSISWMPITFLNNPSLVSPMFSSGIDQQYTIMLATKIGCITVDTLMVKVAKKADIYVPTAFTPNSDGLNDLLHPVLMGIKEFRFFRVYNRWGQLLFQTNRSNTGWDGRLNGTHQPTGVVVWVAEGVGADNKVYTRKGTTVLMR